MVALMVFASAWSIVQLGALGSWTRSMRVSTLLLCVALGAYGCGVAAVVVQFSITRLIAAITPWALDTVVEVAAYSIDAIIEEVVKFLPLVLVAALARRLWAQLGFIDHLLVGAAVGAGFALFEATARFSTLSDTSRSVSGGYIGKSALFDYSFIPSIWSSLTTWLPAPASYRG